MLDIAATRLLIGREVLPIAFSKPPLAAGAIAIVVTLLPRWLTVGLPVGHLRGFFQLPPGSGLVRTRAACAAASR